MDLNKVESLLESMKQSIGTISSTSVGSVGKAKVGNGPEKPREIKKQEVTVQKGAGAKGKASVGPGRMKPSVIAGQQVDVRKNASAKQGYAGLKK